jgi:hypothetical protein
MKLRKVRWLSPCTELAGKGRQAFHRERKRTESKARALDLEDICWMAEQGFAGWIGARTWEVRKSAILLRIIHSISNHSPDKMRFMGV